MKISVIGTGYVGLVAGCCFADSGNTVYCVDVDAEKIALLTKRVIPIHEPGLKELLENNIDKRLFFTTRIDEAVKASSIVFIAVGTPSRKNGTTDLSYVFTAAQQIADAMEKYTVVVMKSTVPVGTCDQIRTIISERTDVPFDVVSNPEFLKQGSSVSDFMKPDRVIVGTTSDKVKEMMSILHAPFLRTGDRILFMDVRSAEMTKYVANCMLAVRISLMNDFANLCELVGADITMVRKGIAMDPRIGSKFLFPGVGYGGSCFPKDMKALITMAEDLGYPLRILEAADRVNERQKRVIPEKVLKHFDGNVRGKQFALWGLSFKPNTDDLREAPSLIIIESLLNNGARIVAYDPVAMENMKKLVGDRIAYAESSYKAVENADALIIVTEWNEFRTPDFELMLKIMARPIIFDGRNILLPKAARESGFTYYSLGRS